MLWYKLLKNCQRIGVYNLTFPFILGAYRLKDSNFSFENLIDEIHDSELPDQKKLVVRVQMCPILEQYVIGLTDSYGLSK